jgi:hypothetical protein
MSEVEFDLILDAVRTAIAPAPQEDLMVKRQTSARPQQAANDKQAAWPLIPFPEGWYAAG